MNKKLASYGRFKLVCTTILLQVLLGLFSVYFLAVPCNAFADSPTTNPTTQESPQEALAQMSDGRFAKMNLDEAMSYYSFHNDTEKGMAELMAQQSIVTSKLEESARKKWGDSAEADVAHACVDATPADLAKAIWTVKDDHAIAQFAASGMAPLFLIRDDGQWKVDVSAYIAGLGALLPQGLQYMKASIGVLQTAEDRLTNSEDFSTANDFVMYLQGELNKLNS
jgi:hypothetical protein